MRNLALLLLCSCSPVAPSIPSSLPFVRVDPVLTGAVISREAAIAVAMAGTLAVSACENMEETMGLLGAVAGAGLAYAVVGDDNGAVLAAAVLAGAAAGGWLGANFGRGLDEAEREVHLREPSVAAL